MTEPVREKAITRPSMAFRPEDLFRFASAVGAYGLALAVLYRTPGVFRPLAPLDLLTARITQTVLAWFGAEVQRQGPLLLHPSGFGFEIYYRCTGLLVALLLIIGILALPGTRKSKFRGALLGSSLVIVLNFIRLTSLFYLGVRVPQVFDFAHSILWETGMLVFVLSFWLLWLRQQLAIRKDRAPTSSGS